jgi:hypothetical protein
MPLETLAGKAISNTYQKVVQTEGGFLADGTGSIVNNLSLPGNLYVSGTIYANNTITITQSYYSGSNIFGDAQTDTQTFTGSMLITGSTIWNISGSPTGYISPSTDGIIIGNSTSGTHIRVRNSNRTALDQSVGFGSPNFGWSTSDRITILTGGTTSGQTGIWIGSSANSNIFKVQGDSRVGINVATATATLHVSGTAGTSSALLISKSGSTVVDIQGSSGQLFSVTDSLTGSLFSVNTVAGLPVMEAFSDNTVNIGKFGVYPIKVVATGTLASITGSMTGSLTGSVLGSSTSASFASTASYVNPLIQNVLITGSLTTTSGINAAGTITTDSEASFRTNGTTNNTYSRLGIFNFSGWETGTQTAFFNGWNQQSYINSPLNIGIASTTMPARLRVRGSGTTNSTTTLLIENANASASFTVKDDGYIRPYYGINFGSDSPSTGNGGLIYSYDSGVAIQSYGAGAGNPRYGRLEVGRVIPTSNFLGFFVGTTIGTNSTIFGATSDGNNTSTWFYFGNNLNNIVSSAIVNIDSTTRGLLVPRTNLTSNISSPAQGLITYLTGSTNEGLYYYSSGSIKSWTKVLNDTGSQSITGSLSITGSAGTGSALLAYKSGSTVVDIQGSQGQLFSVIDSLTGSLMSVNDVSGLPILEVFSDDKVVMGTYGAPGLTVSGSSMYVPTASTAPTGGREGEFKLVASGSSFYVYGFIGGQWRSGSLF